MINIKPKNSVVKNKIAVAKFLNFIRGLAEIFFPFFLSFCNSFAIFGEKLDRIVKFHALNFTTAKRLKRFFIRIHIQRNHPPFFQFSIHKLYSRARNILLVEKYVQWRFLYLFKNPLYLFLIF